MKPYHKIQTVWLRDPETNHKTLIEGAWSKPDFSYLSCLPWDITEKVDGTNIRIIWDGSEITFAGKSDNAQLPAPLANYLNQKYLPIKDWFAEKFPAGVCLYGEGYGGKIQKPMGTKYQEEQKFVMFDIRTPEGLWLERQSVEDIGALISTRVVPTLGSMELIDAVQMCREGFDSQWGDFQAEGVIARPPTELSNRFGERVITKIKCKDFS